MIDNIQDLQKLIKLCRKTGIDSIEIGDLKLKFGNEPITKPKVYKQDKFQTPEFGQIETPDMLPPDALLFYSVKDEIGA